MKYLIIDALNVFIRAFTVVPTMDINGDHVGGTTGFLLTLNKLVRETRPDSIYIVWDGEGGSTKRRTIYKDYKAGRKVCVNREYDFEDPLDHIKSMRRQIRLTKKLLTDLPVNSITVNGVEADDVIAYLWGYVLPKSDKKIIVSSDKDYYQLLDSNTTVYTPTKKLFYTSESLSEELKILPENFIFMKAICGDNSDNIPGIRGIGQKTTVKLFPFLNERIVEIHELFEYCEMNKDKKKKYELILDSKSMIYKNIEIMQLTTPLMSPDATRLVRENHTNFKVSYRPVDMRISLMRNGLQIKASDFFSIFKEQLHRTSSI